MSDPLAVSLRTIHGGIVPLPNRCTPEEYAEVIRRWMPEGSVIVDAETLAAALPGWMTEYAPDEEDLARTIAENIIAAVRGLPEVITTSTRHTREEWDVLAGKVDEARRATRGEAAE